MPMAPPKTRTDRSPSRLRGCGTMRDGKDNTFMELATLPGASRSGDGRSGLDDGGFVLVALLIAMAVTAIWLGTMLPAWRQQAVRQREADLVFRGQQYARAIALYYVNDNCTLPQNVDILVSRHYLRKKWKDPIANDDFVPLVAGMAASPAGTSGTPSTSTPARPPVPGLAGGSQLVGLYGVSSKDTDMSIMLYQNQQQYSLWSFRYTDALQLMGRSANCNNQGQPAGGTPAKGTGPEAPGKRPADAPGLSGRRSIDDP